MHKHRQNTHIMKIQLPRLRSDPSGKGLAAGASNRQLRSKPHKTATDNRKHNAFPPSKYLGALFYFKTESSSQSTR